MRCLWLVAVACHSAHPDIGFPERAEAHYVGSTITFYASWQDQCAPDDGILGAHHPHYAPCNVKAFTMTVQCSRRCEPKVTPGQADVTFLEPGPTQLHAVLTQTASGETFDRDSPTFDVVWPDRVELFCDAGKKSCEAGVDATDPRIFPNVIGRAGNEQTSLFRLNGKPAPRYDLGVSLATLFPDAKTDRGVRPGVYEIEVTVGPVRGQWHVVAR